jgi:hypothetical protein
VSTTNVTDSGWAKSGTYYIVFKVHGVEGFREYWYTGSDASAAAAGVDPRNLHGMQVSVGSGKAAKTGASVMEIVAEYIAGAEAAEGVAEVVAAAAVIL